MKVIDNGLKLFPVRSSKELLAVNEYRELPPIYYSFVKLFKIGKNQKMFTHEYLDERYNELLGITRCINEKYPDSVFIGELFLPEESIDIMKMIYSAEDIIHKQDLFLIGEDSSGNNFFMVGTGASNKDQIFIESSDYSYPGGERITKLFDDIYQFMCSFLIVEIDSGIGYGVEYPQLYKSWGEDFWRVIPTNNTLL